MRNPFIGRPFWQQEGLAFIRIITGLLLTYHGWEIFDEKVMKGYLDWDKFKSPAAAWMVYVGKGAELTAGILLTLGFLTRLAALLTIGTMLYISLFVGKGEVWYGDQHPFLFVLLGMVFLFLGPGRWGLDKS